MTAAMVETPFIAKAMDSMMMVTDSMMTMVADPMMASSSMMMVTMTTSMTSFATGSFSWHLFF